MYDVIIIGSGAAGMTAGIYTSRRALKTLILGKELGGQLIWANEIENYPGFKLIKAYELIAKMKEQTIESGVEMKDQEVLSINKEKDGTFTLKTSTDEYKAKTVIVTMGLLPRRLGIENELELNGKGISYCANCDGPFYRDKTVAIVGGGNSAFDAAEYLAKICKKVYLIHRSEQFSAFDVLVSEVKASPNVEILTNTEIHKLIGTNQLDSLDLINNKTKEINNLVVDGLFIEIGRIASTELIAPFVELDENKQALVAENMESRTPGLFVAGDVVASEYKQLTIAMGLSTIAALAAYQYIQLNNL